MKQSLKWLFAASIGVNILLIGFTAGRVVQRPWLPMMPPHFTGEWRDSLPKEKQQLVGDILDKIRTQQMQDFRKVGEIREELKDIMTAPEFDKDAFIDKSLQVGKIMRNGKNTMIRTIANTAGQFTQEERKALVEHLMQGPPPPMDGRRAEWRMPPPRGEGPEKKHKKDYLRPTF